MAERPQPDLNRVREALREHDERREQEAAEEPTPDRDDADDEQDED
jgi:hypothetical protein